MTGEMLLDAIGEVKDAYISEAKKKQISKKRTVIFFSAAAACLIVFFFIPNIPNFFGMGAQDGDIFRNGYLIEDISVSQLSESYNGKLLAPNIISDGNVEFYSKTEEFSKDRNDWYSLLYSEYNYDSKILLHCMFGEEKEKWKVDMVFTDEATKTVNIGNIPVEIAEFEISLNYQFTHYAIFEYDGTVYDLRVYSNNENTIIEVLEKLIK